MKFRISLLFSLLLFLSSYCQSQKMNFKLSDFSPQINSLEITIADINIVIDKSGNVVTVNSTIRGEVDYWTYDSNKKGKIKSIGNIEIDYWTYDNDKKGKVKSIGNMGVDYWTYDSDKKGKIKSIGNSEVDYWTYDSDKKGKVKSIGNIEIDYWTYDSDKKGKIKSITGNTPNLFVIREQS